MRIDYLDTVERNIALTSLGSFGYKRALTIASAPLPGQPGGWRGAGLDGPSEVPGRQRKVNGVARYSQGTALDGFSVTGMAYSSTWTSTDQIPERAVASGLIGRFGSLDPTDGGDPLACRSRAAGAGRMPAG